MSYHVFQKEIVNLYFSQKEKSKKNQICFNLSFDGRAKRPIWWAKAFVSEGENERSLHQRLLEENVRKTKKEKVCGFWKGGFRSCLRTGKVLAPHALVTRDGKFVYSFPFLYFLPFLYFFYFLGSTRVLPSLLRILKCDEELKPTYFFKSEYLLCCIIFMFWFWFLLNFIG